MKTVLRDRLFGRAAVIAALLSTAFPANAGGPTTSVQADYLMTLYATLDRHDINDGLRVVDVLSGWVDGPRIKGKIVPPSGDWVRTLPSGVSRIDARLVVQTDDNEIIYLSYNGIQQCPKENVDKLLNGEVLKSNGCYFITAPTFETKSERYRWLNAVQTVGKMIELKRGEGGAMSLTTFL
jgi:Protein of unknown function (DUF3237)